ncbi:hypothetical protein NUSPORA_02699 [Nucleospora cyclopteri]
MKKVHFKKHRHRNTDNTLRKCSCLIEISSLEVKIASLENLINFNKTRKNVEVSQVTHKTEKSNLQKK